MTTPITSIALTPANGALVGALLGAIIGSFVATVALRWPRGEGVITGRSRCDQCAQDLRPWELVPILSWLMLRGRCRRCGGAIAPTHVAIETAAAVIGGVALAYAPHVGGIALALLGWQLLLLGWLDARHYWLPHRLSALLALSGLAVGGAAMAALGITAPLLDRTIGAVGGFALLALIGWAYHRLRGREGLGGGDPPMFGAIGAWLGWPMLPLLLWFAAIAGIAIAVTRRVRGTQPITTTQIPLGTCLALATPAAIFVALMLGY